MVVLGMQGQVEAASETHLRDGAAPRSFVGYATPEEPPIWAARGGSKTVRFGLPLTDPCLKNIEELRRGRDLFLRVTLPFVGAVFDPADATRFARFVQEFVHTEGYSYAFCERRIPRSDWIAVLRDLGYGDYYSIDVPLRGVPERRELKKALERLTKAWEHFDLGGDSETLISCYKAFERIALDHGAAQPDQNGWDKVLKGVEGKKREKLTHTFHQFCRFLQLGRHEAGGSDQVALDRADSEYALVVTQATLAYLAKLWPRRKLLADPALGQVEPRPNQAG